jgi:hypothetical protein
MRTRTFALVGLVLGLSVAVEVGAADAPEFKPYASTAGRYKAQFPGAVKTETVDVQAGKDELVLTIDSVELRAGTTFLVTFIDATDEATKLPAAMRLDKVRDGNKGADGKVLEDKELTVGVEKYPARDILIEKPSGCVRNRAVLAGKRLYQVMIQGTKEVVTSASADQFLASFEVTK